MGWCSHPLVRRVSQGGRFGGLGEGCVRGKRGPGAWGGTEGSQPSAQAAQTQESPLPRQQRAAITETSHLEMDPLSQHDVIQGRVPLASQI